MRATGCKLGFLAFLGLLACLGAACDDSGVGPICLCAPADVCVDDSTCNGGTCTEGCCGGCKDCLVDEDCDEATERCEDGECVERVQCSADLACTTAADCAGSCMACTDSCCVSAECASDADCPPEGELQRYCPAEPDPITGCRVCNYVRCTTDAECADPAFPLYQECEVGRFPKCSRGTCECAQPCGGDCPDGKYCCKPSNTCEDIPVACAGVTCPACEQLNPEPGGSVNDETCALEGADCSCVPLPPLDEAFKGQYSAIALGLDGVPLLSGYYGVPYGDLLFGVASGPEAGASVTWSIVDGLPADAPCEGAADGPRGGIAAPGDDVGLDTDLAVGADGFARIAYFDATHGDLKFAVQDAAGWTVQVVDEAGVTGRYASLRLGPDGRPIVAYMSVLDGSTAALKVAWANNPAPVSAADWTFYTLDSMQVACQPASCAEGLVCLGDSGLCESPDDPANCAAGCAAEEVCVAATCRPLGVAPTLDDLPPGVGLFASLALFSDGSPAVAYYDSVNGNLKLALWNGGAGAFDPPALLDGQDGGGNDTGDVGADSSLAIGADDSLHLVYQDALLGQLRYLSLAGGVMELVDQGARDADGNPTDPASAVGEFHWVGNFARLVVDPLGNARVAYQDGTSLDLVYATRSPAGVWSLEILARRGSDATFQGNFGFFVDQALNATGETAHVSNFMHNLRTDPWSSGIDLRTHVVP
ncbi:MAG TPA: hypothetical protein PK668_21255 [Myxococcota bacterium]|nr:hypothetical protein [Myxococcota bacterium]HRY96004.1 hypothetical protein [Myxococcota bacterium]HSA21688.1 hypothetical protein [Myxococcota bacterium]